MERISLPDRLLGRVLAKGQLFSIGILPVCTYADPGFDGRLGITLFNFSRHYISIKPGQPIAKIEFSILPDRWEGLTKASMVSRPRFGQFLINILQTPLYSQKRY